MVWLVIAGPASVVMACAVTAVVLIRHPDPALQTQATALAHAPAEDDAAVQPAMQARNHAATGGR
ncbi:MAG: hypothetical protein JO006_19565 [Paucibacter sp.]|nr:hypothetical protein [Roseateles sp.]